MAKKVIGIDVSTLPKLTGVELEDLLFKIKSGQNELKEYFLLANARLVLSAVQKFRNTKESSDDLFQVGMLGLIKALDNFDATLGLKFSTYAVPMVIGEIRRFVREGTAFKVGRSVRDVAYKAVQVRERIEREGLKEATLPEIAEASKRPISIR